MTVLITLTSAGASTGPFDLYSDTDGYVSAFETGVSKAALLAGYTSSLVPNGTTTVRIKSTGTCTNYIDVTVVTTTTTTTTTAAPCEDYINNTGGDLNGINYTDCGGTPFTNVTIASGQSICVQPGSLSGGDSGFLTLLGNC